MKKVYKMFSFLCILVNFFAQGARANDLLLGPLSVSNPSSSVSQANQLSQATDRRFFGGDSASLNTNTSQYPVPRDFDPKQCKPVFDQMRRKGMSLEQLKNELSKSNAHLNNVMGAGFMTSGLIATGGALIGGALFWPLLVAGSVVALATGGYTLYKDVTLELDQSTWCVNYALRSQMNFNVADSTDPRMAGNRSKAQAAGGASSPSQTTTLKSGSNW
jgi:hypothetical protein